MAVDCHTYVHRDTSWSTQEETNHLRACGNVDAAVVLARRSPDGQEGNRKLSDYIRRQKKMRGFAALNPVADPLENPLWLNEFREQGFCGVAIHCGRDNFHPCHSFAMDSYRQLADEAMPVFFETDNTSSETITLEYARPYLLDEIARTFPAMNMIIGSMGFPFVQETLCLLKRHPNVYAVLSIEPHRIWQIYNTIISAYEMNVTDKLLFGSGYPAARPDQCIETLLGFNKLLADTSLPQVPREKIRSIIERPALELLGIDDNR